MKKYIIIILICLAFSANVFAAETESAPRLLPGNPFYFLKEWNRSIQMVLTFNETKKIELEEKFSSDRLKEIEVLVKKNTKQEVIERATEKYEKSMQKISERLEKVKEKAENNPALQNFVERFTE
ncbi:hypothetical protein KKG36_02745, partial [Patescibacteria group bacterium]|nr:hypothetical protein [Patescibacteria group bacterium]